MAALHSWLWREETPCSAAKTQEIDGRRIGQSVGQWVSRTWSVPPAQPRGMLVMRKGSGLCTQHCPLKENTAAAKPAKLHENKTMNRHEIF